MTSSSVVVATRVHLGHQTKFPERESLKAKVHNFISLLQDFRLHATTSDSSAVFNDNASSVCDVTVICGVIAVEACTRKNSEGEDLVSLIQSLVNDEMAILQSSMSQDTNNNDNNNVVPIELLPVSPWGCFTPALNACVSFAANYPPSLNNQQQASHIIFISAETSCSYLSFNKLVEACNVRDTLVAGAALPGHNYYTNSMNDGNNSSKQNNHLLPLSGRTCPWNTLAVWNLAKLGLTGFPLVGEGLHYDNIVNQKVAAGVEECSTVALIQKLLGVDQAKAKLLNLEDITWEVGNFQEDGQRKAWHAKKMKSKNERPAKHIKLLFGASSFNSDGVSYHASCVIHC